MLNHCLKLLALTTVKQEWYILDPTLYPCGHSPLWSSGNNTRTLAPDITLYRNTQSLQSVIQTKLSAAVATRSALAFLPSAISPSRSHLWHSATIKQASTSIMGRHIAASLWGRKQIKQFYSFMLHPNVSSEHSQAHTSQIFPYISMFNFVTFEPLTTIFTYRESDICPSALFM